MIPTGNRSPRFGFWVVLLAGIFAWAPATYPGYWQGLEGFVPVFNVARQSAIASVAVDADLWRGAGSAGYLLAQPLLLIGFSPVAAVRALFILAFILGGLGVYAWLRPIYGDRAAGLSSVVYMFLPMVLAATYIRGSVSDAMILALMPLTLASISAYTARRTPATAALSLIGILWLWRTQAGLALFATLLLLAYALVFERDVLAGLVVGLSGLAGFVSLIPLWTLQGTPVVRFADHFVYPHQLFGVGWQTAPSVAGWQDEYPFQLGFAAITFGILAIWLGLRRYAATVHAVDSTQAATPSRAATARRAWARASRSLGPAQPWVRLFVFCVVGAAICIALGLTLSAPLWQISGAHRLLTYPWQVMLVAAPLLAAAAGALPLFNHDLSRAPYWAVLIVLVVLASASYLTADFTQVDPGSRPYSVIGPDKNIAILDADLTERKEEASAELAVTWQALQPLPVDYNVFFQALAEDENGWHVIAQTDLQPMGGERPATSWRAGEVFQEVYTLDLSQAASDRDPVQGNLRYDFGYYDWRDGTRLPVDGGIDDKLVFHGR